MIDNLYALACGVERWVRRFGLFAGLLLLPALMLVRNVEIFNRNILDAPGSLYNAMESELFLLFAFLTIASAYVNDAHVRVDILHARLSPRARAWIELIGGVVFVLPFTAVVLWYGSWLVESSFSHSERAAIGFGAPVRWLIILSLPLGIGLFAIAVMAKIVRQFKRLRELAE